MYLCQINVCAYFSTICAYLRKSLFAPSRARRRFRPNNSFIPAGSRISIVISFPAVITRHQKVGTKLVLALGLQHGGTEVAAGAAVVLACGWRYWCGGVVADLRWTCGAGKTAAARTPWRPEAAPGRPRLARGAAGGDGGTGGAGQRWCRGGGGTDARDAGAAVHEKALARRPATGRGRPRRLQPRGGGCGGPPKIATGQDRRSAWRWAGGGPGWGGRPGEGGAEATMKE